MKNSYLIYLFFSGLGITLALLVIWFIRWRKSQVIANTYDPEEIDSQPGKKVEQEASEPIEKKTEEKLQQMIERCKKLEENNSGLIQEVAEHKKRVVLLKDEKTSLEKKLYEMKSMKNGNVSASIPVEHFFYSEVMVTAGPRKKGKEEIDFGEDTCGVVKTKNKTLFWLLDGTSDQDTFFADTKNEDLKIEVFSSRLMVQSISNLLPDIFNNNDKLSAKALIEHTIDEVARKWVKRYQEYRHFFEKGKKCSTTMIVGTLDINGELDAYVVGDSSLLSFDTKQQFRREFSVTNGGTGTQVFVADVEYDQLYLFTGVDEQRKRKQGAISRGIHVKGKGIFSIVCHSDGISKQRSEVLREKKMKGWNSVKKALRRVPVNTEDDKSMLIIELKKP
ncbi:MAG: hypothetical protein MI974_06360 [Chitinophagales bacterium]|nr:hypothetical protein [Chitinophagales bacterium]